MENEQNVALMPSVSSCAFELTQTANDVGLGLLIGRPVPLGLARAT